jgi:hypothetical protein
MPHVSILRPGLQRTQIERPCIRARFSRTANNPTLLKNNQRGESARQFSRVVILSDCGAAKGVEASVVVFRLHPATTSKRAQDSPPCHTEGSWGFSPANYHLLKNKERSETAPPLTRGAPQSLSCARSEDSFAAIRRGGRSGIALRSRGTQFRRSGPLRLSGQLALADKRR